MFDRGSGFPQSVNSTQPETHDCCPRDAAAATFTTQSSGKSRHNEEEMQGAQRSHQANVQQEQQPPRWGTPGHRMNPAVPPRPQALEATEPAPKPFAAARVRQSRSQRSISPKAALSEQPPDQEQRASMKQPLSCAHLSMDSAICPDQTLGKEARHCQPGTKTGCSSQKADGKNHPGKESHGESKGGLRASDRHASGVQAGPIIAPPKDY
ncbi:hypothetical protein D4764_01G0010880 [Takifugu flavidus]|uniref:Uncharacterized protein n=1 Tax=Takifugu flavidus TaxID=433684 RepID=A0A5C6PP65_9TELE|nr:hypothetical protein D4764_01G0010880 [Takifugu flavidus]